MNRLFVKIFLGFWLTMIAVVIVTAIIGERLRRADGEDPLDLHFARTQSAYAAAANSILEAQGSAALAAWLGELRGPGGPPASLQLLDDAGLSLLSEPPARDIVEAIEARGSAISTPAAPPHVYIEALYDQSGERYWFISDMRRAHFGARGVSFGPRHRGRGAYRFVVAILVSGLVCFLLARYLTTPIRRLQSASAEIANGNFEVRVAEHRRFDELGDLGRDFDRMAEHLSRLNTSQRQLLRDVSHELRSPLARLQVALGLARQRGSNTVAAELDRIERETQAPETLIAELLSVARIESVDAAALEEIIDLADLLEGIVRDANFEAAATAKSVNLTSFDQARVRGDRSIVRSAFENVIRNAVTHTPENTEVIVSLWTVADHSSVVVRVSDCGDGVADEKIADLFKPFVRAEDARERGSGGFGIGLAIVDAAIKRHAGEIKAYNEDQGGFCIEITLPLSTT